MKIFVCLSLLFALSSCCNYERTRTDELVFFANNFELLSETKNDVPTLSARIFKVREFGECDNGNCPEEHVYVALSEFGERPEQKVYKSKASNEWRFLGWVKIPELGDQKPLVTFKLSGKLKSAKTEYLVKAGLEGIEFIAQRPITP